MMKKTKGITLIGLVVTIIILLILAGVSVNLITGTDGILGKTEVAVNETQKQIATEKINLKINTKIVDSYEENRRMPTLEELATFLSADEEIQYVKTSSIASADTESFVGVNEIFTKLWEYPYEFEIDEECEIANVKSTDALANIPENKPDDKPEIEPDDKPEDEPETEKLPENTTTTDAGTEVALKEGWATETARYINVETGKEVTGLTKIATVYAVSDGQGNTVPVPYGFYYVGGTIASGVVISDDEADKNKYAGQADVPSGIEAVYADDGETVTGIKRTLQGNQFVWIPCTAQNYKKYDWGTTYRNNIYSTDVTAAELSQVQKYGGFYVGRYESGLDKDITVVTTTMVNDSSTQYNVSGTPRIQAGIEPWNFVSYTKSKENAESLYSNSTSVNSGLLTGTMWDTMMYFMGDNSYTSSKLTSSAWGNYANTTPTITLGKTAKGYYSSSAWRMDTFTTSPWTSGTKKTAGTVNTNNNGIGYVWTTGSSEECKLKNLYDVAGNTWEWIEETATTNNEAKIVCSSHRVTRGGSIINSYAVYPACYRTYNTVSYTISNFGFRVALYMK